MKARKLGHWVLAKLVWANATASPAITPLTVSYAPWCLVMCCLVLRTVCSLRQVLCSHSTFVWLFA